MTHDYKEIYYVNPKHHYIKTYTNKVKWLVHFKHLDKNMESYGNIKTLTIEDFKKFISRNKYSITYVKGREYDKTCRKCKTEFKTPHKDKEFCEACYKKANQEIMKEISEKLGSLL